MTRGLPDRGATVRAAVFAIALAIVGAPAAGCGGTSVTTEELTAAPDAATLEAAAVRAARGREPGMLTQHLASAAFLDRLDPPDALPPSYAGLRLANVVGALAESRNHRATDVLVDLANAPEFTAHVYRIQLLVHAFGRVRPAPQGAVAFWGRAAVPESPVAYDVVDALLENRSEPALGLLEKILADPGHGAALERAWFRNLVLPRRHDPAVLAFCDRVLRTTLPAEARPSLVEALFAYDAGWYRRDDPPRPPSLDDASGEARDLLRRVGEYALTDVPLEPACAEAVRTTLQRLAR